ncbi:MAG TPA: hypothetical protein VMT68_10330 [Caulobacteraceae bacterium]|nr:hypothetical protein [Caulobacteraceae bacterium]
MDDDDLARIEIRLQVLETLVAFQFAAQHMQSADPAAAIARLRALLLERQLPMPGLDPALADAAQAELAAAVDRILALQDQLPRRLVD